MGLYERIVGTELPKLPVHQFQAAVAEFKRGKFTGNQVATAFALSAAEKTEATTLLAQITSNAVTAAEVQDVLCLAEAGYLYADAAAVRTRLGV